MVNDLQDEIADFLSRPESHGVSSPVELIDTHVAMVFLAGDFAYKIKREVVLPYLDFSTAAKRKAVLEDELRLNNRTAPDLYLEIRAIGRDGEGKLGFETGEPLEWVLVMRRFSSEALLLRVAERGALGPDLVRTLADSIAFFHEDAATGPREGGAQRVRQVIEGSDESLRANAGILDPETVAPLRRDSLAWLDRLAPLLDRRAQEGCVRHCHGDLHLGNICIWKGEPTLFDCLEFDAELATTDVLYDLAFLLMDLWERGYRRQACLLFNRYCDMTGELDGIAALPLFLSMRAAIRAFVSASAVERQDSEAARESKREDARDYLATAVSLLDPARAVLLAIGGRSGTGKSTLAGGAAHGLGRAPGARWLRSDVLRKRMAGLLPEESLPPEAYTPESSRAVYERLIHDAKGALAAGQSVLVDAAFLQQHERTAIEEAAREAGVQFTGIWLEADPEVLRERVSRRIGDASDADVAVVERQLDYDIGELGAWHRIDAGGAPAEAARRLAAVMEGEGLP